MGRGAVAGRSRAFRHTLLGLVGDVTQHARLGAGAEEGALRAFQHFDALQVRGVHVEVAAGDLGGLVIEVHGHVRPLADRSGTLRAEGAHAQTTHIDVALAGAHGSGGDARQILDEVFHGGDFQFAQRFAGERLHGNRHVLDVFRTALCSHNDLFDTQIVCREGHRSGLNGQHRSNGRGKLVVHLHESPNKVCCFNPIKPDGIHPPVLTRHTA